MIFDQRRQSDESSQSGFTTYTEKSRILGLNKTTLITKIKEFIESYWKILATMIISIVLMMSIHMIFNRENNDTNNLISKTPTFSKQFDSDQKPCKSVQCYTISHFILNHMNQSHDPCDNFYDFVCGEWIKKKDQIETDQFTKAIDNFLDDFTSVMEEPISQKTDSKIISSAKKFYKTCTNESDIENFSDKYLYQFFSKEFGEIPMLQMKQKSENYPGLKNEVKFVSFTNYGIEKFLAKMTILDMPLIFRFKSGISDKSLIVMKLNTPPNFCVMQNFLPKTTVHEKAIYKLFKDIIKNMKSEFFFLKLYSAIYQFLFVYLRSRYF